MDSLSKESSDFIYCPFSFPKRDTSNICLDENVKWLEKMKLALDSNTAREITNVSLQYFSFCHPKSYSTPDLKYFINFASWTCILDDYIESPDKDSTELSKMSLLCTLKYIAEEYHSICYNKTFDFSDKHPIIESLIDLIITFNLKLKQTHLKVLMQSLAKFLSGLIWEVTYINVEDDNLDKLCALKLLSSGVSLASAMSLCLNNLNIEDNMLQNKKVLAMEKCILFVMAIDNDLYSYEKEKLKQRKSLNFIKSIKEKLPLSELEAIKTVIYIRNQCLQCYVQIAKSLEKNNNLDRYKVGLEDLIVGNILFGNTSSRYGKKILNSTKILNVGKYQFSIKEVINQACIPPELIPSISWWWYQF